MLPNTCINFQLIPNQLQRFTDRVDPLPNHKLHRTDHIYLYPYIRDQIYLKLLETCNNMIFNNNVLKISLFKVSLSYYHGIFLSAPKEICYGLKCYLQKSTVKSFHTSSYHLKVDYPSNAFQPLYINTEVVTHPTEQDMRFFSFEAHNSHFFSSLSESFSWLSSTIFHINCLKYVQDTIDWSGLSLNLMKQICENKNYQSSENNTWKSMKQSYGGSFYVMHSPVNDTILSNLWTLKISFKDSMTGNISNYGILAFSSNPLQNICNQNLGEKHDATVKFFKITCSTLETTVNLNTKLLNKQKEFEVGLQKFEDPKVKFYPDMKLIFDEIKLLCIWNQEKIMRVDDVYFKSKFKLLKFAGMKYSWMMAAEKCQEYGITLPHLQNKRKTREFILFILNEYALPIYALFVGLVTKVCKTGINYSSFKILLITYLEFE